MVVAMYICVDATLFCTRTNGGRGHHYLYLGAIPVSWMSRRLFAVSSVICRSNVIRAQCQEQQAVDDCEA